MLASKKLMAKPSRTPVDLKVSALQKQGCSVKGKAVQFSVNIN